MTRFRGAAVTAVALGLVAVPSTAGASGNDRMDEGISTVATGLDGPRQVNEYSGGRLVVAESDSGEVSAVDPDTGAVETLISGLFNPQGVDYSNGRLYVAVGGPPPPEEGAAPPADAVTSALLVYDTDGNLLRKADLLAYELAHNPDGQLQFGPDGAPVDALSNPFAVHAQKDRILVADAGANAVLALDRHTGELSTFFVPPVVTPEEVAGCDQPENDPGAVGCDPVPTGVTEGPDGRVYVSTLGALVPGAARVYVLDQKGQEVRRIEGFSDLTGIAVDRDGVVYASDLLEGLPEGQPGPDFDPGTVGQVVRVDPNGDRTYAQVTMPSGLVVDNGDLYASAWSVASMLMMPSAGQVVRVGASSFGPPPAG
jgi:DNA-binding beta-propeller fold protein YncE